MIDGPAGMWCMQTGYGRREIADAVADQIMHLGYSTAFSTINPREVELARRIAGKPLATSTGYSTTGGSTAVDSALRLCQLANNIKGERQRKHILSRHHAYHGSTFLSASVTGKGARQDGDGCCRTMCTSSVCPAISTTTRNLAGRPSAISWCGSLKTGFSHWVRTM